MHFLRKRRKPKMPISAQQANAAYDADPKRAKAIKAVLRLKASFAKPACAGCTVPECTKRINGKLPLMQNPKNPEE